MNTPPPLLAAGSPTPRASLPSKRRSLLTVLVAVALSSIGMFAAPQAAHAADGVTKNGTTMTITAGSSPFSQITSSDSSPSFQVHSAAHGDMVYPFNPTDFLTGFSFGDFSTGTITAPSAVPVSPILTSRPTTGGRDNGLDRIGGSGTPADPWWFEMGVSNASYQLVQRVSYAAGAPSVRVDLTVKNLSASDFRSTNGQLATGLDCVFAGSDKGPIYFQGDAIQCASGADPTGARMTYAPIQAPRLVAGGDGTFAAGLSAGFGTHGVMPSGATWDKYWDPATHTCYGATSSANPSAVECGNNNDNGILFSWAVPSIPAGQSVTRSYVMSFDADTPVVALSPNVTVDQPTVGIGGQVTYTATVANAGPDAAPNAQAGLMLPAGMQFVSSNGNYDPVTGVWETGPIAVGGTATLTLVARATTSGQKSLGVSQIVSNTIDTTLCAVGAEQNCGQAATVTVTNSVDLTRSTIVATPSTVVADGTPSTVTVSLKDALGNPFTDASTVAITSSVGTVGVVTDNGDGTYTANLRSSAAGFATVSFTVSGVSSANTATVTFTDATPPDAPIVDPSDGSALTGTAEPGSTVTATDPDGHIIGSAVAGADGRFTIIPKPPLVDGTVVTLVATDDAGNESAPTQVIVRVPVIVEPPQETPVAPVAPVAPVTPVAPIDSGQLAHTGSDVAVAGWWGLLLLALGCGSVLLIAVGRRKEKEDVAE